MMQPPPFPTRRHLGQWIAYASLRLPFAGFAFLIVFWVITGDDQSNWPRYVCLACLALSVACGVVALVGIVRWGERGVWVPAVLGIALSTFAYVFGKYGGP